MKTKVTKQVMTEVCLKKCLWLNKQTFMSDDGYVRTLFTSEEGLVYVIGKIHNLHELCVYEFNGYYDSSFNRYSVNLPVCRVIRIKSYSFDRIPPSPEAYERVGLVIKQSDSRFRTTRWLHLIEEWRKLNSEDQLLFFSKNMQPVMDHYASINSKLSYWIDPTNYIKIYNLFETMLVFSWKLETIRAIESIIDTNPYSLCYSCPRPEMKGVFVDLPVLEQICEVSDSVQRKAVDIALHFLDSPYQILPQSNFDKDGLEILVCEKYLTVIGTSVVRTDFFDVFKKIQGVTVYSCEDQDQFKVRILDTNVLKRSVHFILPPGNVVETSLYDVEVVHLKDIMIPSEKYAVLLHADQWGLSDINKVIERFGDPKLITLIGFASSLPSRFGYNLLHLFKEHQPINPVVPDFKKLSDPLRNKCFHLPLQKGLDSKSIKIILKKFSNPRSQKITWVCEKRNLCRDLDYYMEQTKCHTAYVINDRVLQDKQDLTFVNEMFDTHSKNSVADVAEAPKKRRRINTTAAEENKSKQKRIVGLKNGEKIVWKSSRHRLEHWNIKRLKDVHCLYEDLIVWVTDCPTRLQIESLQKNCKKLLMVSPSCEEITYDSFEFPKISEISI